MHDFLCGTSTLNFLCIILNQIEDAEQIVTLTFHKLSKNPDNLVILMEGSVGICAPVHHGSPYDTPRAYSAPCASTPRAIDTPQAKMKHLQQHMRDDNCNSRHIVVCRRWFAYRL